MFAVVAASFAACVTSGANADLITNGGFETGDFTGWTTIGDTSIETAAFGTAPTDGTFQALLTTEFGEVTVAELETFFGLSAGAIDTAVGGLGATSGSAIRQTITVSAGDELTFAFNFLTDEDTPEGQFIDSALLIIENGEIVLADTLSAFNTSATVFTDETGYLSFLITFTTTGTSTLGFAVIDVGDDSIGSGLLIDRVLIHEPSTVPEPSTLALFGIGLLGAGIMMRRRRVV